MRNETKTGQDGNPRTKGIRNAIVAVAMAKRGGPMRDRRDRRPKDARRHFTREEW